MKALLVVDMQLDFMPGGSLAVSDADQLVSVINRLQPQFDLVIATQDWHPPNHQSFIADWPVHCVQGSVGSRLHPELDTHRFEAIFRKGMDPSMDSYSVFYDNGHVKSTGLTGYLREREVDELYFCGVCADVCFYFSIQDALKAGFACTLIDDAVGVLDEADFKLKRMQLLQQGVRCLTSDECI